MAASETCCGGRAYMVLGAKRVGHVTRVSSNKGPTSSKFVKVCVNLIASAFSTLIMLTSRSQPELVPPSSPKCNPAPPAFKRPPVGYAYSSDVHMNTAKNLTSKDIMAHAVRSGPKSGLPIMDNDTLSDVRMDTARAGGTTVKPGLQLWELELIESPEIKRKATVAQLCEGNS